MDMLKIERKKKGKGTVFNWEKEEWTETEIEFRTCEYTVPSSSHASILRWKAGYGVFPNEERRERVNTGLFKDPEEKKKWSELFASDGVLRLSAEEVMYLIEEERVFITREGVRLSLEEAFEHLTEMRRRFFDVYTAYRYLRRAGWTPRCGLSFGCDYVIYEGVPSESHASAGVLIERDRPIDNVEREALSRSLWHVKKHLIILSISSASHDYGSVDGAQVTTATLAPASLNGVQW
ncbi:hypothetical protein PENTCL1PPCAC_18571 [Pristionchus entomophagus]|uniref:tRNA-intron lyase n=1 Tax=Pristionchus entomophagus TaxID=358040 RepID=A0AAV5TPX9_9BILA|nr:hypothetical protein PENTCL1PPCAC_18571 [Pristionchus entomophagus]